MGSSQQRMKADNKRAGKKGSLPKDQQFVQLINAFRAEPAWLASSFGARCLYIEIKAAYTGMNNGRLMASARFAAKTLRCNKDTASGYFRELQDKGFIIKTRGGHLGVEGRGHGRLWRLTELGFMGEQPTKDYKNWRPEKFKSLSEKPGQGVRKTRTVAGQGVRKTRTGCPKNPDGNAASGSQECPKDRDNLIYQGEGDAAPAAHASANGDFIGEPRKFTATIGGRPARGGRS